MPEVLTFVQECRHAFVVCAHQCVVFVQTRTVNGEKAQEASRITTRIVKADKIYVLVLIILILSPLVGGIRKVCRW